MVVVPLVIVACGVEVERARLLRGRRGARIDSAGEAGREFIGEEMEDEAEEIDPGKDGRDSESNS